MNAVLVNFFAFPNSHKALSFLLSDSSLECRYPMGSFHPRALGLVTALRKVRAPSGLDQSKIPFPKRKPVFHVRFLPVGVPFHNPYLTNAGRRPLER